MTSFYHARLVDGLATADAVRRADLGVLNARRERGASVHPAYWAAFQATGDRR
jgi:CHAT domain-containing protein